MSRIGGGAPYALRSAIFLLSFSLVPLIRSRLPETLVSLETLGDPHFSGDLPETLGDPLEILISLETLGDPLETLISRDTGWIADGNPQPSKNILPLHYFSVEKIFLNLTFSSYP